jgi:putative transposase
MPRKLREDVEGAIHHVFARGNRRQRIFRDGWDLEAYLRLLGEAVCRYEWRCMGYCLMPNHVHLLIEAPLGNLARGMQWLHGRYAERFNKRHKTSGHLFQGRYGGVRIKSDAQLLVTASYIARNPLEAGLCDAPDEWMWGSYPATLGLAQAPPWLDAERLLSYFAAAGGDGRTAFGDMTNGSPM